MSALGTEISFTIYSGSSLIQVIIVLEFAQAQWSGVPST